MVCYKKWHCLSKSTSLCKFLRNLLFVFVSYAGIFDPVVRGTGNTLWAGRRARKEVCLLPDTTPDLLHAPAVVPALLTRCVTASVGACYLPSKCHIPLHSHECSRISEKLNNISLTMPKCCSSSSAVCCQITHTWYTLCGLKISCIFVGQFHFPSTCCSLFGFIPCIWCDAQCPLGKEVPATSLESKWDKDSAKRAPND